MIQEILGLFVNTLTVDDNHYLLNRDNLAQQIQMQLYQKLYLLNRDNFVQGIQRQLCQKQKTFSEFLYAFLKSILNFKH